VPGRKSDEEWAEMTDEARWKHRAAIAVAHTENARRASQRAVLLDALDTATDLEPYPQFWFPWCHDFRLRRYPASCGGLSPQGADVARNLMMFSRGKPLGPSGFYWLCVRLANAMGQDKLHPDDRVGWVLDRMAIWERIDADPVRRINGVIVQNGRGEVDNEPWAALAALHEVVLAYRDRAGFVSHLPVPMDGSCNGLQHLSAMGLDPVGAEATNMAALDERRDVYLLVADHVAQRVERDAEAGIPEAIAWRGKVGRDTVKRTVLATPYGITDQGIQRQLILDRKVPRVDDLTVRETSAYLRDALVDALADTVVAARRIMGWLQDCATRLAEAGEPMVWRVPTGSTLMMAYRERTASKVNCLAGQVYLYPDATQTIDARKQAAGASPNVVHSFDAAHLALTVNALGRHYGVQDFAMIHDSFGVHAADVAAMHAVLRAEFVRMYEPDRLAELHAGFRERAPHVDLPDPPPRGGFDLAGNVPNARFFFS